MAGPSVRDISLGGAIDARDIVPVEDVHGGVTVYFRGQLTHYLLGGEWFAAAPKPGRSSPEPVPAAVAEELVEPSGVGRHVTLRGRHRGSAPV